MGGATFQLSLALWTPGHGPHAVQSSEALGSSKRMLTRVTSWCLPVAPGAASCWGAGILGAALFCVCHPTGPARLAALLGRTVRTQGGFCGSVRGAQPQLLLPRRYEGTALHAVILGALGPGCCETSSSACCEPGYSRPWVPRGDGSACCQPTGCVG